MPKLESNNVTMNYERQGTGPPLILIPYLAADHACYAFQVPEYASHFTCFSVDLRGTGESDKPPGPVSIELLADDIAGFMQGSGIEKANIFGLSLGAAIGLRVAAKYPSRVKSLSLHSCWAKTDPFLKTVVENWQLMAKALGSVSELVVQGIFPWCFTPEMYAEKPEVIKSLAEFVRGRPAQPLNAFHEQANAVIAHDVETLLANIEAPTQITFGQRDVLTSTRFADALYNGISNSEMQVFEECSHAPLYENVEEFNRKTLTFLKRQAD